MIHPTLHWLDIAIIAAYVLFALWMGLRFAGRAGLGVQDFFVGDRKLPWWLAGTSIVATTFAADTPLAVTGLVASGGIAGNWLWWSWGIAHLTATFFFARMWRRSGVITDAEITELRYSGRPAALLRAFKALYFGLFINVLTMAWVIKAMVKISQAFFDWPAAWVISAAVVIAVAYTVLGGFHSVVATDLVQFILGMAGAIILSVLAVQHFGGLGSLTPNATGELGPGLLPALDQSLRATGQELSSVIDFIPGPNHPTTPLVFFVVLLFAGWWRYAEGNGYIVQRLAACRDEGQAQGASLWFAIAHNALRPWPWILVALAALIIYPQIQLHPSATLSLQGPTKVVVTPASLDVLRGGSLVFDGLAGDGIAELAGQRVPIKVDDTGHGQADFLPFGKSQKASLRVLAADGRVWQSPDFTVQLGDREMAYPLLMGKFLPIGLLGLVIASLLAAFMSTIDTHTNWGASYLVQDIYKRFIKPGVDEKRAVLVSRLAIVLMAILAGLAATFIDSIASVWRFLVMLGAGLGSVSALRWYWSRVTAYAEFAAMAVTTVLALSLQFFATPTLFGGANPLFVVEIAGWAQILMIAGASLATWIPVSLLGPRTAPETLRRFAQKVRPPGPSWAAYRDGPADRVTPMIGRFVAGLVAVYGALFALGELFLGSLWLALLLGLAASLALAWIIRSGGAFKPEQPTL